MQKHLLRRVMTSREFNQDLAKAKRIANEGPLTVTDRGKPAYVLMTHKEFARLSESQKSIVDLLRDDRPEADFDFDPPRLSDDMGLRIPSFDD